MDKKERKLQKGSGFHLDIVLICLINVGCGFLGTPWICAATVRSVAHISAVTVMSRTHAPGEKPHIIEVKEQRVSALTVSLLVGLSVLMAPLLRLVPMSVLFGVFLYMGVASTDGIQFFDRMKLFFMPVKHHPQASYVRRVSGIYFRTNNLAKCDYNIALLPALSRVIANLNCDSLIPRYFILCL